MNETSMNLNITTAFKNTLTHCIYKLKFLFKKFLKNEI